MRILHLLLLTCLVTASAESQRPNILYFYVDDMGWGSIGPNGQDERREKGLPSVRTPNLDRMAKQGLNFTRGYGCFVCSPARASQQSGFHQGHTFADRNDPDNAKKAMRTDDVLMGDALSAAGYNTGYWGKWGFGATKDQVDPQIVNVQTLPTSHGYQNVLAELHHVRAHTFFQPTLWKHSSSGRGGLQLVPNTMAPYRNNDRYPDLPARQNHPDYPETAYCDDSYAFAALDFVREQAMNYRETGEPFFALLAVQIPHAPFGEITQLPKWDEAYSDDPHFASLKDQSRQWAAMVTRIDAHFGNILAALEDPNGDGDTSDRIADNTLVIFQSDNGGPSGNSQVELDSNGGLRGSKGTIFEGGIRVPLVMRWPAEINEFSSHEPGSDCDAVVDVTDLLPTFCELAETEIPLGIDGVSIAPLLRDEGQQRPREFLIHETGKHASIIRGNHKLIRNAQGQLELYDLACDHSESKDIASDHPDLVSKLETTLLGERVTEPKGFAATYHHWTGKDGAAVSVGDNWSDYRYANEGITYQLDADAPHSAWVARMINRGSASNVARGDKDLHVLALEIRGDDQPQTFALDPGVSLIGNNEIRIGSSGRLQVNGGRVASLRWIDVQPGGDLDGTGDIEATIYNAGTIAVKRTNGQFQIAGDYHQSSTAELAVPLNPAFAAMEVQGDASLDGRLSLVGDKTRSLRSGETITLLRAEQIHGKFTNKNLTTDDGQAFTITYTPTTVAVTVR